MKRRRVSGLVLLVVLLLLGFLVYSRLGVRMGGTPAELESPFPSEEGWLLSEIVTDVTEMTLAAGGASSAELEEARVALVPSEGDWIVQVELRSRGISLEHALPKAPHLWSPHRYAALVDAVMPGLEADRDTIEGHAQEHLLAPTATTLIEEDRRLTGLLGTSPASPHVHEQAALLLASFALRESAGEFSDPRSTLSRASAHLAMAMALRRDEPLSGDGRIALAAISALAGRELDALLELEHVDQPAWGRALRMRVTEDWRLLDQPETASFLEQLEWFRALARTLTTPLAMARYQEALPQQTFPVEALRLAIESYEGPSDGYYFRGEVLEWELDSVRATRRGYGETLRALDIALDDTPGRFHSGPEPAVLGWPHWAAYYQRHLAEHLVTADTYFREGLALVEGAEAYRQKADPHLSRMRLYPWIQMRRTARKGVRVEDIEGMQASVRVASTSPERVNAANWHFAANATAQMALRTGMPRASDWFSPALATTTTFDARHRLLVLGRHRAELEVGLLREIAPSSAPVWEYYRALPRAAALPEEEVSRALATRAEYDLKSLRQLWNAAADRGEETLPYAERACGLDPEWCFTLGNRLLDRGREADAAVAYRRGFDQAVDRVRVANGVGWLVEYYERTGRTEEALLVAQNAAETYSRRGLETLGRLLELRNELEEAEGYFERAEERYDNPTGLIAFYYRLVHVRGLSAYEAKLARALADTFPQGLERYDSGAIQRPPTDGVLINSSSRILRRSGLASGDIILALDGWRVRTLEQYEAVREFTREPGMKLAIWRVNALQEVEVSVRSRRFDVDIITYAPRSSIDS